MIFCESCEDWFHGDCVNITPEESEEMGEYICNACERKARLAARNNRMDTSVQNNDFDVKPNEKKGIDKRERIRRDEEQFREQKKRNLIVSSIQKSLEKDVDLGLTLHARNLAEEIEAILYAKFGKNDQKHYISKCRELAYNIGDKDNQRLRGKILSGELTPEELSELKSEDLVNEERAEELKKAEEDAVKSVLKNSGEDTATLKKTHKGVVTVGDESQLESLVPEFIEEKIIVPSQKSPGKKKEKEVKTVNLMQTFSLDQLKNIKQTKLPTRKISIEKPKTEPRRKIGDWVGEVTYQYKNFGTSVDMDCFYKQGPLVHRHLPSTLKIENRLDIVQFMTYMMQLRNSSSRIVSYYTFKPQPGSEENYKKLFSHLNQIKRAGVFTPSDEMQENGIKELFIFPLKGSEAKPEFFERSLGREKKDILIGAYISEQKRKRHASTKKVEKVHKKKKINGTDEKKNGTQSNYKDPTMSPSSHLSPHMSPTPLSPQMSPPTPTVPLFSPPTPNVLTNQIDGQIDFSKILASISTQNPEAISNALHALNQITGGNPNNLLNNTSRPITNTNTGYDPNLPTSNLGTYNPNRSGNFAQNSGYRGNQNSWDTPEYDSYSTGNQNYRGENRNIRARGDRGRDYNRGIDRQGDRGYQGNDRVGYKGNEYGHGSRGYDRGRSRGRGRGRGDPENRQGGYQGNSYRR